MEWRQNGNNTEGLEGAREIILDEKVITDRIEFMYAKMIKKIRQERDDEEKEAKKKAKQERDKEKKLAEQKPSNLLEGLVNKVLVDENLIHRDNDMEVEGQQKAEGKRIDIINDMLSTNGRAPSASGAKGQGKGWRKG